MPDYDGRGNPDASDTTWAVWIPRVVLAPVYYPYEYLIHRPLAWMVTTAERHRVADSVKNLFEFDEGNGIVAPTALFDFGLLPSVGVYFGWDDVWTRGNDVRMHVGTWGPQWINVTTFDRYRYDDGAGELRVRGDFKRAEDNLFFGIGPAGTAALQSRYGLQREQLAVGFSRATTKSSRFSFDTGVEHISFTDGTCCGDPSLADRIAAGLMPPPGYGEPYTAAFGRSELVVDSRKPEPRTGVYLRMHGDATFRLDAGTSWIGYGANAGGSLDVNHGRQLKLQVATDFVDPMGGRAIPFTELAVMSDDLMGGFVTGWMIGRSTAVAQLAYTWPIWAYLGGQVRASVGNAFGEHLSDFAPDQLRWSTDVGLTSDTRKSEAFEIVVGVGSETFAQGGGITSVRVAVGSRKGF